MSSGDGRLREVVTYESLDHNELKLSSLEYDICWDFEKKNPILPFEKLPFLVLARNTIMLPHLIICSSLHYLSTGRLQEVKNKGKFQPFTKVVAVAYKRWSLTRGSKLLVFWKTGHWGEVVTYERWSQPEVRLYITFSFRLKTMQNSRFCTVILAKLACEHRHIYRCRQAGNLSVFGDYLNVYKTKNTSMSDSKLS